MKDRKMHANTRPSRRLDFVIEDVLEIPGLTGMLEELPDDETVTIPRYEYDMLVRHNAIYDALWRMLMNGTFISDELLKSLLDVPKLEAKHE